MSRRTRPVLILASASPRRRALLESAGVTFEVRPADLDERVLPAELPKAYARRVAREKALAVVGDRVLAADTVVALDGAVLGKPAGPDEARVLLTTLSGRTHTVYTAVALRVGARVHERICATQVRFRELSERDITTYLATGEPYDKAGGYGIQGHGGALVDRVSGSYTNVIGLPLRETLALLARFGAP
ncbi:MAG: nucleoside triphosphate pyrophosphatase [Myxococcota bacterium]